MKDKKQQVINETIWMWKFLIPIYIVTFSLLYFNIIGGGLAIGVALVTLILVAYASDVRSEDEENND